MTVVRKCEAGKDCSKPAHWVHDYGTYGTLLACNIHRCAGCQEI